MQTQIDEQGKRSHNKVLFEDLHSPNAYHAYLRQNSRRNTAFPKTEYGKSYAHRNPARGTQALSGYAGVPAC